MSTGGEVLLEDVAHFNGGLFDGADALPLSQEEISILYKAALLDWAEVEPAIFGTLFERSLDPSKRSQLDAHYTSREDILRIVEPVIKRPLRQRWNKIREAAEAHLAAPPPNPKKAAAKRKQLVDAPIATFLHDLHQLRTLDPASGSGNFLYVALQAMKDLEHEIVSFAEQVGAPGMRLLGPKQFHGIEINPFARELASMVVWIGYLQWNRANGISSLQTPILEPLENIQLHDALMNEDGTEYEWPEAEFLIGNPPFLGNRRMRRELGDSYVDNLRQVFNNRLSDGVDLVTYWFEKARAQIEAGRSRRAGLIATNSIRGGANRHVLDRIKETGDIFFAWGDEPWVLDGAAVRVSLVGFDDGSDTQRLLDGSTVKEINAALGSGVDVTRARRLPMNRGRAFQGVNAVGPFDIPEDLAKAWLGLPNASGLSNEGVLRPYVGGRDIMGRASNRWVIDFAYLPQDEAEKYEVPFEYVRSNVKPIRDKTRREAHRVNWWRFGEARQSMREALGGLERFIAKSRVSKHSVFVWVPGQTLASDGLAAIAADDHYTFGVLNSTIHEAWALAQGTWLGAGNDPRYTPSTCFETFPFPGPSEQQHDRISSAAKHLDDVRSHLLSSDPGLTMTNLYNEVVSLKELRDPRARAFPLLLAHQRLDEAVAAAYGWEWPLSDEEILERLLALNLDRSAEESSELVKPPATAK